ncbi:MAG TPA: hypothetical protein VFO85_03545, partial [Vicinamibacteria bacterium]|nr:hypothetical protein [Vicinamibacteria bacterium]
MSEADNAPAWDGRQAGRYEVWYLTFNHLASRTGFWIRYTLEAPRAGAPGARVWFAAFDHDRPQGTVAFNRRYPRADLELGARPFQVRVGASCLRHDGARGEIEGAGHHARWDLAWAAGGATHRHLPAFAYRTPFADTRVLSPNPLLAIDGTVEVDGRRFDLCAQPGGQSHLWGRAHADAWAWGRCSAFDEGGQGYLETLTVRVRRAGFLLPPLTFLTLRLDGAEMRFTAARSALRSRGRFGTGRYEFAAASRDVRLQGEFTSPPELLVQAEYADPGGDRRFCANTEVGDLALTLERRLARAGW